MIAEYLEQYTYANILASCLARVPDELDKREGSIIFDAISPACYELATAYMELKNIVEMTYILTSWGEALDYRVAEQGIFRYKATKAQRRANFIGVGATQLQIGARFSTIDEVDPVIFTIIENEGLQPDGSISCILECETEGIIGNNYFGALIPLTFLQGIDTATLGELTKPARDVEGDEELRYRYLFAVNNKAFGGNVAEYKEETKAIDGVGDVQVYPVWQGGGTVGLSIIDPQYMPISDTYKQSLQNIIDPLPQGLGLGLAPIDHKVTIMTPNAIAININADITLASGFILSQIQDGCKEAIFDYLAKLRKQWGVSDKFNNYSLSIYISQITAAILEVVGVANVTNVTINNQSNDLIMKQSPELQELPVNGEVILNAS